MSSASCIPHVGACWIVSQLPSRSSTRNTIVHQLERFGLEILSVNELKTIESKIYSMEAVKDEPSIMRYSLSRSARKQTRVDFVRRAFFKDGRCEVVNGQLLNELEIQLRESKWTLHGSADEKLEADLPAATATTATSSDGTILDNNNNSNVARASSTTTSEQQYRSNSTYQHSSFDPFRHFPPPNGSSSGGGPISGYGYNLPHIALHTSAMPSALPPNLNHTGSAILHGWHDTQQPISTSWEDAAQQSNYFQIHDHYNPNPQQLHHPSNSGIPWDEHERSSSAGMTNPPTTDNNINNNINNNVFSTTGSNTDSNGPKNAKEFYILKELRAIQFTDDEEVLNGIRHCGDDATVDSVMLHLITQREELEEARREDAVRLLSENQKEEEAERKKKQLEERLDAASADDLITIFPGSWILEGLKPSRLVSIQEGNKSSLHKFLQLESKSRLWYSSLPCHYFNKICTRLNSGDDDDDDNDDENAAWLEHECKTLQSGLFKLKEQIGGIPKLFLNERPAQNVTDDDDVIEIIE
jgi:hypothetical protein